MSSLHLIPCELAWKIIEYIPESVLLLRSTSRLLRSHVDRFAKLRVIPLIKRITFNGEQRDMHYSSVETPVNIHVPTRKSKLFSLRLCLRIPLEHLKKYGVAKHRQLWEDENVYRFKISRFNEFLNIVYLRECVGKLIEIVEIDENCDRNMLEIISELLQGAKITRMKITYDNVTDQILLFIKKIITPQNVDQLSLCVGSFVTSLNMRDFLIHLANTVHSIHILQSYVPEIDNSREYLFGICNANWASIILEMFSKKMNKLYIVNHDYPRYLPSDKADLLKERLSLIGKEVWFSASCKGFSVVKKYTHNNHSAHGHGCLIVKHLSRENEYFEWR